MKLTDCEISHMHVRGANVAVIIGDGAVSTEDGQALLAEYIERYGPDRPVAYVSRDGWQVWGVVKKVKVEVPAEPAAASAAPADETAADAAPAAAPVAEPAAAPAHAAKKKT